LGIERPPQNHSLLVNIIKSYKQGGLGLGVQKEAVVA